MTKWHKYRDIKPSIKSIIKSKENSQNIINERRSKIREERLFLLVNSFDECLYTSEDTLKMYKEFSLENKSLWLPIELFSKSTLERESCSKVNLDEGIESELDEKQKILIEKLTRGIPKDETLWIYLDIEKKRSEIDSIQCKARVMEIILKEEASICPDKKLTIKQDLVFKSQMWIRVSRIVSCGGLKKSDFALIVNGRNLKETILESQGKFYIVEKSR